MKRFIFCIISTVIAASCNLQDKDDNKHLDNSKGKNLFTLVKDSVELTIPIDAKTPYATMCMSYYVDSTGGSVKRYLAYLNVNTPSIQFYDLDEKTLSFLVELEVDGPNSVGIPTGFKVVSLDSIFVASGRFYKISLINGKGKVIKYCSLLDSNHDNNENIGKVRVYTPTPLYFIGDWGYMNVAPDRNVFTDHFFEGSTNVAVNFSTCESVYFNSYPSSYKGEVWGSTGVNFSTTKNEQDKFVYSFAADGNLYVFDPDTDTTETYYAGSRYIDLIEPMEDWSYEADRKYVFETANYGAIIYDVYRDLYYRIVKHAIPEYDETTGAINSYYDKPFSIIILNKDFQILGETKFPGEIYNFNNFFLTEEGLYMSNSNDKNPDLNENELSYALFKVDSLSTSASLHDGV